MERAALNFALILALAFGSPVAACCRMGAMWGWNGSANPPEARSCGSCCAPHEETPQPAGPCEGPDRCECRAASDLIAPSPAAGADFDAPLAAYLLIADAPSTRGLRTAPAHDRRARPPPTLVALHCSLTT